MSTMILLITLALGLLVAPFAADAQPVGKVPRIGLLAIGFAPSTPDWPQQDPFVQALRELGYVESQTMVLEGRWAEGHAERLPALAADLVRVGVDVIVVGGMPATQAAMDATTTIPIVVRSATYPVDPSVVANLARPGGNVTGVIPIGPEVLAKQLELLKEAVPRLARVGVLRDSEHSGAMLAWQGLQDRAPALGLTLSALDVPISSTLERLFAAITQERPDALYILAIPFPVKYKQEIADFAATRGLPTMGPKWLVDVGGLMGYTALPVDRAQRTAAYVDRILKGAKPATKADLRVMKTEIIDAVKDTVTGLAMQETVSAVMETVAETKEGVTELKGLMTEMMEELTATHEDVRYANMATTPFTSVGNSVFVRRDVHISGLDS
jgi:putative ABC transport system substrate-binding protein